VLRQSELRLQRTLVTSLIANDALTWSYLLGSLRLLR
jgi:hypothetical protein